MKANELSCKDLMVGDWVKPKNIDFSFRVGLIGVDSVWNDTDTHEWDYDELEPIPLTSDILEKNGFEKCEGNEWSFFEEEGRLLYEVLWNADELYLEISSYTSRTGEFYRMGIEFVHQLQQALRVCGIEKEIEL